jgi:plasmid stabilization system protein ParE
VARLAWTEHALEDLARLADFLAKEDPASAGATFDLIQQAVGIVADHPLIGRRVSGEQRELVISRGRSGYLALYEPQANFDRVLVYAIRHQREAGFEAD